LLGIAHQLIKVDPGNGDEGACPQAAFDDSLMFQAGQSMASRHEAHFMGLGQFALGRNRISRLQNSGRDAIANLALDSLVSGQPVVMISSHIFRFAILERPQDASSRGFQPLGAPYAI
jgi:hypothetical protein